MLDYDAFDVWGPSRVSNFKKSDPPPPDLIVIVITHQSKLPRDLPVMEDCSKWQNTLSFLSGPKNQAAIPVHAAIVANTQLSFCQLTLHTLEADNDPLFAT